jgi:sarcosine oxidase subunit gamma
MALSVLRIHWSDRALVERLERVLGGALPRRPGRTALRGLAIFWLAPFEWMIEGDMGAVEDFLATGGQGALFHLCSVADATGAFELEGEGVEALIAQGCSIDLHPTVFPVGSAVRTLCAGIVVLIERTGDAAFRLWHDASDRAHLAAWLERATGAGPIGWGLS